MENMTTLCKLSTLQIVIWCVPQTQVVALVQQMCMIASPIIQLGHMHSKAAGCNSTQLPTNKVSLYASARHRFSTTTISQSIQYTNSAQELTSMQGEALRPHPLCGCWSNSRYTMQGLSAIVLDSVLGWCSVSFRLYYVRAISKSNSIYGVCCSLRRPSHKT